MISKSIEAVITKYTKTAMSSRFRNRVKARIKKMTPAIKRIPLILRQKAGIVDAEDAWTDLLDTIDLSDSSKLETLESDMWYDDYPEGDEDDIDNDELRADLMNAVGKLMVDSKLLGPNAR